MNKITVSLSAIILLAVSGMFGSCGNSGKQTQEIDTFKTSDLVLGGFQGHIKEAVATTYNTDKDFNKVQDENTTPVTQKYAYTKDGIIGVYESMDFTQTIDEMKAVFTRNNNSEIMRIDYKNFNDPEDIRTAYFIYEWENGLPTVMEYTGYEWGSSTRYNYGENGFCFSAKEKFQEYSTVIKTDYTYEYTEFDSNNNWTKRKNTIHIVNIEENDLTGESSIISKENKYSITERTITYY